MKNKNSSGRFRQILLNRQSGQSMTEFIIIFPVLLMFMLGAFQFALIFKAKSTLNYATFEAARAASVANATLESMYHGLSRGLMPLFVHGTEAPDLQAGRLEVREIIENNFVLIERINPTTSMFSSHGKDGDTGIEIPNDNLSVRDSAEKDSVNIQDANILKIKVSYCHRLIVPFVKKIFLLIYETYKPEPDNATNISVSDFTSACSNAERAPIVSQAVIRMQSPAYEAWDEVPPAP